MPELIFKALDARYRRKENDAERLQLKERIFTKRSRLSRRGASTCSWV
jgi:hypothetical protein